MTPDGSRITHSTGGPRPQESRSTPSEQELHCNLRRVSSTIWSMADRVVATFTIEADLCPAIATSKTPSRPHAIGAHVARPIGRQRRNRGQLKGYAYSYSRSHDIKRDYG